MKRSVGAVLVMLIGLGLTTGCVKVEEPERLPETTTAQISETDTIRPQDDYYYYVNKDRLDNAEFEYGKQVAATAFDQHLIDDQIDQVISDVVAGNGYDRGTEEDLIDRAYDLYTAYDFENEPVPEELTSIVDEIKNASSIDELLYIDAELVRDYGCVSIFNCSVRVNYLLSGEYVLMFNQIDSVMNTGLDEIREGNSALNSIRRVGRSCGAVAGYDADSCDMMGTEFAYLVFDIYSGTDLDILEAQMPFEYMELISAEELYDMFTNADLEEYLSQIGYDTDQIEHFVVCDRGQLQEINDLLVEENIEALRIWEISKFINKYLNFFGPHYAELGDYYRRNYDSPEEQALDEISKAFTDQTDPLYVERFYLDETDRELRSMCDDIKEGYRDLITNAEWLSEETREGLLHKLDNIIYVTGSDCERHDPEEFYDITGDNYFDYYLSYIRHMQNEKISELTGDVSRSEIGMYMQEFNACYNPSMNNITITVAITNAPFFDVDADYYTNLGGLGMVIAHEMGHAFDSNCILFDENGVYDPSWISSADTAALNERNEQAVTYFEDNFTVFGVYHVDGEQTLGENYADLGGMECIVSLADNEDELRLLFENYATIWCEKKTDSVLLDQIAYDEHSPETIRVNAILSTVEEFYEVYDVTEGDGMYIAPENRISRWH